MTTRPGSVHAFATSRLVEIAPQDLLQLACISVTYHPDLEILTRQFEGLPANALKVIVDNASGDAVRAALHGLAAKFAHTIVLECSSNLGLAAGINRGVECARKERPSFRFLLLLDQDTEPTVDGVTRLMHWHEALKGEGRRPGAVGPRMLDPRKGIAHGFHQIAGLRWVRTFQSGVNALPVSLANLNGSGTFMETSVFEALGGLREDFFIDHVDTEWSFRLLAAGYRLYGIPDVTFTHRMGERTFRFWMMGWRLWPYRSPLRHYYLFRNAVSLLRTSYVPSVWKAWAVLKLGITILVHLLADPARWAQVRKMGAGIRDGLRKSPAPNG